MSGPLTILFAGGGTGGHLYPGLTLAEAFQAVAPQVQVAFFVTHRDIDRRVLGPRPYKVHYEASRGLSMRPWTWLKFLLSFWSSGRHAREFLQSLQPSAVIGLGGFGSYAAVREAQKMGLPNFILNPDLHVGRANARLAPRTDAVFCQFEATIAQLRSSRRVEAVGCPVRKDLFGIDRSHAAKTLGLSGDHHTLVVTGGGLGAQSINRAMALLASRLVQFDRWQVLHLTGQAHADDVRRSVVGKHPRYYVRDYVDEMGLVYALADLMICRAGASTIAELTALGVPSVLMPYPFHRDHHQEDHARVLEDAGAAVMARDLANAERNVDVLWQALPQLMEDDGRRERMAEAARLLGHPEAAQSIVSAILSTLRR
ncbi:MAG: UDP-N-acetylglucosamine--N-acetylmuramyl-(pentapeptide) pyrophosphoryl-undecaprenol N-acetylglucosamine transferase [Planctomycetes bacterium]|nr:UDP-N-acetylglucosamine--N-acetylmuramyl-(pentapeptide) pyrophosphoryl-undecaprenol N-acetylglucosamine transferase [Planctomycetota bacterium]